MTPVEFAKCVNRTLLKDGTPMPLHFAALGIAGEVGEVMECATMTNDREKLVDECGDVLWYVHACAHAIGSSFEYVELLSREVFVGRTRALCVVSGRFVDKVKKRCWHGRTYEKGELERDLADIVAAARTVLSSFCGKSLSYAYEANNAKLLKRYPEGFAEGGGQR